MSISLFSHPLPLPMTVPFARGQRVETRQGIRLAALRVPLAVKLAGANVAVIALLVGAWIRAGGHFGVAAAITVAVAIVLHLALALIALRPIRDLETVASRIWSGDFAARVSRSAVADQEVLRVGSMFNILLDSLAAERARMRALASDVIEAGEKERAALARELQDSTAQHVAALLFELSAAARDADDPVLAERLRAARDAAENILEEVRSLSHSVHPAVLDDLGLEAALRKLARDAGNGNAIDFDVDADFGAVRLPSTVEAALYRVAQEAVRNAARHARPRHVRIIARRDVAAHEARLEIHDDGAGFDLAAVDRVHPDSRGLNAMRERMSLVDGTLEIKTANGSGTTVSAAAPLDNGPVSGA